jgi:hypothetical protein
MPDSIKISLIELVQRLNTFAGINLDSVMKTASRKMYFKFDTINCATCLHVDVDLQSECEVRNL